MGIVKNKYDREYVMVSERNGYYRQEDEEDMSHR